MIVYMGTFSSLMQEHKQPTLASVGCASPNELSFGLMASSGLVRWGEPAAMLGGVLFIVFAFVGEGSWVHLPLDAARYALLVVGIVEIYLQRFARQLILGETVSHESLFEGPET